MLHKLISTITLTLKPHLMKHAMLCCMFFLFALTSYAQFTRGDKALGGFINLNLGTEDGAYQEMNVESDAKSFSINPSLEVFISRNLSVGGGVGYSQQSNSIVYFHPTWTSEVLNKSSSVFLKLGAKRYFELSESFFFSVDGLFTIGKGKYTQTVFDVLTGESVKTSSDDYNASVSVGPSFHFFPTRRWSFQAGLGSLRYSFSRNKDQDLDSKNFGLNLGQLSFGISYFFRREISAL